MDSLMSLKTLGITLVVCALGYYINRKYISKHGTSDGKGAPIILTLEEETELSVLPSKEEWSIEEVSKYDGSKEVGPILIAINGKVYNVWKGRCFYGAGAGYQFLAGKDATRLLAKNLLDPSKDDGKPLTESDKQQLSQWQEFFDNKYGSIGKLKSEMFRLWKTPKEVALALNKMVKNKNGIDPQKAIELLRQIDLNGPFNEQDVSLILHACGCLGMSDLPLRWPCGFEKLCRELRRACENESITSLGLSISLSAICRMNGTSNFGLSSKVFVKSTILLLPWFTPQQVTNTIQAFARFGWVESIPEELWQVAMKYIQHDTLTVQGQSMILDGLSHFRSPCAPLRWAEPIIKSLLQKDLGLAQEQAMNVMLHALANLNIRNEELLGMWVSSMKDRTLCARALANASLSLAKLDHHDSNIFIDKSLFIDPSILSFHHIVQLIFASCVSWQCDTMYRLFSLLDKSSSWVTLEKEDNSCNKDLYSLDHQLLTALRVSIHFGGINSITQKVLSLVVQNCNLNNLLNNVDLRGTEISRTHEDVLFHCQQIANNYKFTRVISEKIVLPYMLDIVLTKNL